MVRRRVRGKIDGLVIASHVAQMGLQEVYSYDFGGFVVLSIAMSITPKQVSKKGQSQCKGRNRMQVAFDHSHTLHVRSR